MQLYLRLGVKILVSLVAAVLIAMWVGWFVQPEAIMSVYEVSANSLYGLNMLKSDMGGFVLTLGILTLLAVWRGGPWFAPALLAQGVVLGTRCLSVALDGFVSSLWVGIMLEVTVLAATLWLFQTHKAYANKIG